MCSLNIEAGKKRRYCIPLEMKLIPKYHYAYNFRYNLSSCSVFLFATVGLSVFIDHNAYMPSKVLSILFYFFLSFSPVKLIVHLLLHPLSCFRLLRLFTQMRLQ